MALKGKATFKCPYCGHENKRTVDTYQEFEIVYCDCEEGGCDNPFAVKITTEVVAKTEVYPLGADGSPVLSGYMFTGDDKITAVSMLYKGQRFDFVLAGPLAKPVIAQGGAFDATPEEN